MKDPFDNEHTQEISFPPLVEAMAQPGAPAETVFETTLQPGQADAALKTIRARSFSERNPHLGKMINCKVCGRRHRTTNTFIKEQKELVDGVVVRQRTTVFLPGCEQKFTYIVDGYEYFRDGEDGKLVPDYRTAVHPDLKPTRNQIGGQPLRRNFAKPRYKPHPNASQLQLVERTRLVFTAMGFKETEGEQAQKNMEIARTEASRQLRAEAEITSRKKRKQQKLSRRINRDH